MWSRLCLHFNAARVASSQAAPENAFLAQWLILVTSIIFAITDWLLSLSEFCFKVLKFPKFWMSRYSCVVWHFTWNWRRCVFELQRLFIPLFKYCFWPTGPVFFLGSSWKATGFDFTPKNVPGDLYFFLRICHAPCICIFRGATTAILFYSFCVVYKQETHSFAVCSIIV